MSTSPDDLEPDVDRTRQSLSQDVARFNERVSPANAVSRRTDRLKAGMNSVRDRLMGSSDSPGQAAGDKLGSAAGSVQDATDSAAASLSDAAGSAPQTVREQTQGNPLAAGLIAFGAGWLLSSLLPASAAEQQAARKIEDHADGVVEPVQQSAQEIAANLKQPLQESAQEVRGTAQDAASRTSEHAKSATAEVRDNVQDQTNR